LINYLGGERELMLLMRQRLRIHHPFPFNFLFTPLDVSQD
jgi:hypothetical protein